MTGCELAEKLYREGKLANLANALFLIGATLKEEQANHAEEQSYAETPASATSAR